MSQPYELDSHSASKDTNGVPEPRERPPEYQQAQSESRRCHCRTFTALDLCDGELTAVKVGNEFSQVEGLWSQFENVMAKEPEPQIARDSKEGATEDQAHS